MNGYERGTMMKNPTAGFSAMILLVSFVLLIADSGTVNADRPCLFWGIILAMVGLITLLLSLQKRSPT
jgi:hypothetical protein